MENNHKSLKLAILEQLSTLMTAGFGFVAALAWNEAIQAMFRKFFPENSGIVLKFLYAVVITIVVVLITTRLSKLAEKLKHNSQS
ncbi:hypothetical protein A3B21_01665 [Candidatus Uhrbacteria bacterium RIFCSPLOWO2_01_FULL_47_24]|uniref:Uncharacterized protein n=1 Tax=Candidatus Uhrbacteria bacterium RIFCSPLOWO2_01_FULL_47_24 TaxID=1802401 RepID=A0A1F7UP59_9BACT|nr:MAG: hypothetical protein A2794_02190 [Alphaproteobacteria bacterium RIFCSPHIGHO2_01_FULL_40_8]OGL67875.1 MAG: hypothetical protein A3D58_04860 [Candidatus Uhrbacteria bacterium RIFCSPHIGHO2_02_FULL_46_47]OGL75962.1 MAG: hypothetical protein A3F52_05305 [Candidatus Uhrbacteria bacterium RIFCSPHIGHO2_12_FULL_47_11]OGL80061.1 MAG: hypothetical protein A3B21_01665 [Candidatus Uhrbacteria bacterium RIFCSPLOWO2_01_FULL_47_24]OGL84847.1 MAG: hypothetical protein A3J03_04050 [Candidatus Uhrbacteria